MASEFLEILSPNALEELKQVQTLVKSLADDIKSINNFKTSSTPSGADKNIKGLSDAYEKQAQSIEKVRVGLEKTSAIQKQVEQTAKNQNKATQNLTKEELSYANAIERGMRAKERAAKAQAELSRAYVQLVSKQQQAKKTLQDLIVTQGTSSIATKKAQKEYDKLTAKVNQANKATSNFSKTGLGSAVSGLRNLMTAFGVVGGIQIFASAIKDIFELTKKLDGLNFAMQKIIPSNYEFARTQEFLKQITNDFGTAIVTTTERYIKFLAAAKQSNVSLKDTEKIFGTVTKSAGVLGLKTDELNGVYLALEQMLSKGKVTTEELRRQLGERLPGAFGIMAKAVGVSVSALDGMLKKGEVLSAEWLPKFAEELERAYGIESVKKVDTLVAAQNRLSNAWVEFVGDLNASAAFKDALNFIAENLSSILNITFKVIKGFIAYKIVVVTLSAITRAYTLTIEALAAAKIILATATGRATASMRVFNIVSKGNPIGLIIGLLGAAAAAWVAFKDGVIETSQALKALEKQMYETSKVIVEQQIKILDEKTKQIKDSSKTEEEASKKSLKMLDEYEEKVISGTASLYTTKEELDKALLDSKKESAKKEQEELDKSLNTQVLSYQEAAKLIQKTGGSFRLPTPEEEGSRVVSAPLDNAQLEILAEIARRRAELLKEKEKIEDEKAKKRAEKLRKDKFDLEKRLLEIEIEAQKEIIDNVELNTAERLEANSKYLEASKKLIDLEKNYALGEAEITAYKIKEVKENSINELKKLEKDGLENRDDIFQSDFDRKMDFYKKLKDNQERILDDETATYQNSLIKQGLSREKIEEKVKDRIKEIRKKDLKNFLENEIVKLEAIAIGAENRIEVEKEIASLRKMLSDLELPDAVKIDKATEALKDFFKGFQDEFFSEAGLDFTGKFLTEFDKFKELVDAAPDGKKWTVWATGIMEIAQEAYNFINQMQTARFDAQYERLEKEKDVAIQFAGESDAAKERIEEQYEARKKAIQRREAKAQKEQAIINAVFNTAQAVISTWAQVPKFDFGISAGALAAIVGGIGAAQIALIASTPIPEFKDGVRDFDGGLAVLGDGGVSEIVRTPDGKISKTPNKDTLYNLPKGTDVFKNESEFNKELDKMLDLSGINLFQNSMSNMIPNVIVQDNGIKPHEMDAIIGKHFSNLKSFNVNFDENGVKKWVTNGNATTILHNNRTSGRGTSV